MFFQIYHRSSATTEHGFLSLHLSVLSTSFSFRCSSLSVLDTSDNRAQAERACTTANTTAVGAVGEADGAHDAHTAHDHRGARDNDDDNAGAHNATTTADALVGVDSIADAEALLPLLAVAECDTVAAQRQCIARVGRRVTGARR